MVSRERNTLFDGVTYHVVEEELEAMLPAQPEVSPGEEHAHGVPHDVVSPPLLLHLSHSRVDEGEARVARLVSLQVFLIVKPGNVDTDGVPLHLSVERVVGTHGIEEFPPDEVRHDGEGDGRVLLVHFLPGVHQSPVELPHTQTSKLDVRRERFLPNQSVRIILIGQKCSTEESLPVQFDPPGEELECLPLPPCVRLGLVPLPLYTQHGWGGDVGEDREGGEQVRVGLQVDKGHVCQVNLRQRSGRRSNSLGDLAEMTVGEGGRASVSLYDLKGVPQSLSDALAQLDPVGPAVVLHGVVSVQPDGLGVLIKTQTVDIELLSENSDHVHWVSLHKVDFSSAVEELSVEIIETLQKEGNLVVFTVICGRSFSIKNEYRKQLAILVTSGNLQALIVVKS